MDFINDHLIVLAAGVLVLIVIVTAVVMAVRLRGLLRQTKAARRRLDQPMADIQSGTARTQRGIEYLQGLSAEEQAEIRLLQARLAELQVLAGHAGRAIAVLRTPLRYLGK